MNLIESMMEDCRLMNRIRVDDEFGGYSDTWQEGATFQAAVIKNTTTAAEVAEKQGISEIFNVVVRKGFPLDFHDVFKRLSDGAFFRVTSNLKDSEAPAASSIQIAKVTAERWILPE